MLELHPAPARTPRRGLLFRGALATALSLTGLGAVALSPAQAAVTCAQTPSMPFVPDAMGTACTFTLGTTGSHTLVVPNRVGVLTVALSGAAGGSVSQSGRSATGGKGGSVSGNLASAGGRTLTALVGGQGQQPSGGAHPGGTGGGGAGIETSGFGGGSGGGGTFLAEGTTLLAAAGGGGGASVRYDEISNFVTEAVPGGAGSGGAGAQGGAQWNAEQAGLQGRGATIAAPGLAGTASNGLSPASPGAFAPAAVGQGITAGSGGAAGRTAFYLGGGGGGGYYGGGGGYVGGGGGSGYSAGLTGASSQVGTREGNGSIIFTYVPSSGVAPGASTDVVAVAGNGRATVSWHAPADDGGAEITKYTVTSSPDGKTCELTTLTGPLSCQVTGLDNDTAYTFTVTATNSAGTGPASTSSNSVTPHAPVEFASSVGELGTLLNSASTTNACGGTVELEQPFAQNSTVVSVQCGSLPVIVDLNGVDLTLASGFLSGYEEGGLVSLTSTGADATLASRLFVRQGGVRLLPGITVVASGVDRRNTLGNGKVEPGVFMDGPLDVAGGTLEATSPDPRVPAIGGFFEKQGSEVQLESGSGSVLVSSGSLKATGAAPTEEVPQAAPAIGGATAGGLNPAGGNGVPATVTGGTLTLSAGNADTVAFGAGPGYTGTDVAPLTFGGRLANGVPRPAVVELETGRLPVKVLAKTDEAAAGFNTLVNDGAVLPSEPNSLTLPSWLTVTGHHYAIDFGGTTGVKTVAADTASLGELELPTGYVVGSTALTDITDLSDLATGVTRNAATGAAALTATQPPVDASTVVKVSELMRSSNQAGHACGRTIRLVGDPAPDTTVAWVNFCDDGSPVTIDLNGRNVTVQSVNSSFSKVTGAVRLVNTSSTPATFTGAVGVQAGDVEVGPGVTIAATGTVAGQTVLPGVGFPGAGRFVVDGGDVVATSVDPRVPAVGGIYFAGNGQAAPAVFDPQGSVLLKSGSLTANGAVPGALAAKAAPAVGGATSGGDSPIGGSSLPVRVEGGTLTLNAGSATTQAYGPGPGYEGDALNSLTFAGTASTATVVLQRGTIPAARLAGGDDLSPQRNVLDNSGAVLPAVGQALTVPTWLKVTGDHYRVQFPGEVSPRVVVAESFAAGGVGRPAGSWTVGGKALTPALDLATAASGVTPDATSGAVSLTAVAAPYPASSIAELQALLRPSVNGSQSACGGTVQLTSSFTAAATDSIVVGCGTQPVTIDVNGVDLTLEEVVGGNGLLSLTSTGGPATLTAPLTVSAGGVKVLGGVRVVAGSVATGDAFYPGVWLAAGGQLEVAGGTVEATSTHGAVPAVGGASLGAGNFQGGGTVLVSAGTLKATGPSSPGLAPAIGAAMVGMDPGQRGSAIPVTVTGGSLVLDAGAQDKRVLGVVKSGARPTITFGGTASSAASVEITAGTMPIADLLRIDDVSAAHNTLVNKGTLTHNADGDPQPTWLKITGNNHLLTFPTTGAIAPTRRLLAPTLAAAGLTLPDPGRWKVGSTKLTATTLLSGLTGTVDQATGRTDLTVEVGSTPVGSFAELKAALEKDPEDAADCAGTPASPELVVVSARINPETAGVIEVGCAVELDLAGKAVTLGAVVVGGQDLVLTDSGEEKGSFTFDQSRSADAGDAVSLATGGSLVLQGVRVTIPVDSSIDAPSGTIELDATSVLDLKGTLVTDEDATGDARLLLDNDGTILVPLSTTPWKGVRYVGNAFLLTLDPTPGDTTDASSDTTAFVLAATVGALGSTVSLPSPTASYVPEDSTFEGWRFGAGTSNPVDVDSTTDLREQFEAATGEPRTATLTAVYTELPGLPEGEDYLPTFPDSTTGPLVGWSIPVVLATLGEVKSDTVGVTWQWQRKLATDTEWSDIVSTDTANPSKGTGSGASVSAAYAPTPADLGYQLRLRVVTKEEGFKRYVSTTEVPMTVTWGPILTADDLAAALAGCEGPTTYTLGADISAPTRSLPVGCSVTLDLAGFDLTLAQLQVPDGTAVTVSDSGRLVGGATETGLLTLDGTKLAPAASPFAFAPDGDDDGTRAGSVTVKAAVALGGEQVLPAGSSLTVATGGVLMKVGGDTAASISGPGSLDNRGLIGSRITVADEVAVTGIRFSVTFHPSTGMESLRVFGPTLASVGAAFPTISPLDPDSYVRWGTSSTGGTRVTEDTELASVSEGTLSLYPRIVKKGTVEVSSYAELAAAVAAVGTTGGPQVIALVGDVSAPAQRLTVPDSSTAASPVRLDLNGFDLVLDSIRIAPGALVVDDSTAGQVPAPAPGSLVVAPHAQGEDGPGVVLASGSSFTVAGGVVSVTAAAGQPGIGVTGPADAGAVTVSGGVLRVVADLAVEGETAFGSTQGGPSRGSVSVTGGELQVRGLSTNHSSVTIGSGGRVTALTAAAGGLPRDPEAEIVGDALAGAAPIANGGVITGDLAGITASVSGRHYGVSFSVPSGVTVPDGRTVYAGSVAASGVGAGAVLPVPARPGFTFTGWNTKADGSGTVITAASDLTALGLSESGAPVVVELFAQFVAIPVAPSSTPTASPTASPTGTPTGSPTATPTSTPTATSTPTVLPTGEPTLVVDPITGGGSTGGSPQVGVPVTVSVVVPDVPGAAVAFQWQVVLPDGKVVDVPGATGDTYVPEGEYAGYGLQVVVTISAPGYAPSVQVVSFPRTQPVRPGVVGEFTIDRKVRGGVQEHPLVGQKVMALLPMGLKRSLPQGAVLGYQWSKARKPIRGVNGSRRVIEVGEGMVGRKLRLTVTVTAPGYVTYTVAAPKTRVVKPTGWTGKKKR